MRRQDDRVKSNRFVLKPGDEEDLPVSRVVTNSEPNHRLFHVSSDVGNEKMNIPPKHENAVTHPSQGENTKSLLSAQIEPRDGARKNDLVDGSMVTSFAKKGRTGSPEGGTAKGGGSTLQEKNVEAKSHEGAHKDPVVDKQGSRKHDEGDMDETQTVNSASPETFPQKLYQILEQAEKDGMDDIVSFFPHGRAFAIHKPRQFVSEIMPKYFTTSRMSSFQRQLNLYGFRRITDGPEKGGYFHDYFLKGEKGLCSEIKRKKSTIKPPPNFFGGEQTGLLATTLGLQVGRSHQEILAGGRTANQGIERFINDIAARQDPTSSHGVLGAMNNNAAAMILGGATHQAATLQTIPSLSTVSLAATLVAQRQQEQAMSNRRLLQELQQRQLLAQYLSTGGGNVGLVSNQSDDLLLRLGQLSRQNDHSVSSSASNMFSSQIGGWPHQMSSFSSSSPSLGRGHNIGGQSSSAATAAAASLILEQQQRLAKIGSGNLLDQLQGRLPSERAWRGPATEREEDADLSPGKAKQGAKSP